MSDLPSVKKFSESGRFEKVAKIALWERLSPPPPLAELMRKQGESGGTRPGAQTLGVH